jgi:hypothetical protein
MLATSLYIKYTLPVEQLHVHQILVLALKFFNHRSSLPDVLKKNCFILNNTIHCHNARTKDDIYVHSSNFSIGQKCLQYKIGILWNSLPSYCVCLCI